MKTFMRLFLGILLVLTAGCTYQVGDLSTEDDMSKNLIASFTSDLTRTTAIGSALTDLPQGTIVPSLMQNNLDPGEYTIQFEALPPADNGGFAAYAIVNWKVLGQQVTRKVSVFSGAAISGVGEAVDVKLVDVSGVGVITPNAMPYKIAANLSRGTRAMIMQPAILTTQPTELGILAAGTSSIIIPTDAGIVSAMVLIRLGGVATVDQVSIVAQNAATNIIQGFNIDPQNPTWVPLPPSAVNLLVINGTAASIGANVIWGIEG